jgi:hypothetical protein
MSAADETTPVLSADEVSAPIHRSAWKCPASHTAIPLLEGPDQHSGRSVVTASTLPCFPVVRRHAEPYRRDHGNSDHTNAVGLCSRIHLDRPRGSCVCRDVVHVASPLVRNLRR